MDTIRDGRVRIFKLCFFITFPFLSCGCASRDNSEPLNSLHVNHEQEPLSVRVAEDELARLPECGGIALLVEGIQEYLRRFLERDPVIFYVPLGLLMVPFEVDPLKAEFYIHWGNDINCIYNVNILRAGEVNLGIRIHREGPRAAKPQLKFGISRAKHALSGVEVTQWRQGKNEKFPNLATWRE